MSVPELGPDLSGLTDEQIIKWYRRHPNSTVRALVDHLALIKQRHAREVIEAYASAYESAFVEANRLAHAKKPPVNPYGLSESELQIAGSLNND